MSESVTASHYEKQLTSEEICKNHVFTVTYDKVLLENGHTSMRFVVHHRGGACIAPLDGEGNVWMVRQYRYALQEELLELPAGKLEPGEDPFESAKRELEEECGLVADRYLDLGVLYPTVGYDSEKIYTWAAVGLHPTRQHLDADEFLTPVKVPLDQAVQMVLDGSIRDGKTVAGILKLSALRQAGVL